MDLRVKGLSRASSKFWCWQLNTDELCITAGNTDMFFILYACFVLMPERITRSKINIINIINMISIRNSTKDWNILFLFYSCWYHETQTKCARLTQIDIKESISYTTCIIKYVCQQETKAGYVLYDGKHTLDTKEMYVLCIPSRH